MVLAALGAFVGGLVPLLAHSWDLCRRSWAALEACVGGLGRSWGLSWRSWAALGAYVGGLGLKNAKSMPTLKMCVFLERGRDLRPGGGLGPLLGLMLAVLGRSWSLCWRSWAALGTYVGGLGPLLGPMLAVLGRS